MERAQTFAELLVKRHGGTLTGSRAHGMTHDAAWALEKDLIAANYQVRRVSPAKDDGKWEVLFR